MNNNLLINCFPIKINEEQISIYWSETQNDDLIRTVKSKLTCQKKDKELIYWSSDEFPGAEKYQIDATTNMSLFRDYLNEELHRHFKTLRFPLIRSFLGGSEVWILDPESRIANGSVYHTFSLRILNPKDQFATSGWTILLVYLGERTTLKRLNGRTKIPDQLITKYIQNYQIHRPGDRSHDGVVPPDIDVVINRSISNFLNQQHPYYKDPNKYLTNFNRIYNFYESQLKGRQIGNSIHVLESGMGQVFDKNIRRNSSISNVLEFGGNRTHFNAYMGLKEYGPVTGPKSRPYKFFFIFSEKNRDYANKLFQYFRRGFKGYPGLKPFVDVDLNLEKDRTIIFADCEHPHREVEENLSRMTFEHGVTYLAIYISPINRDESDDEKRNEYYLVKEALLAKGINSQAIFAENIYEPNFHFFLPNISIAILAKLNGTPWRLSRQVEDELVIGIGAYRQNEEKF